MHMSRIARKNIKSLTNVYHIIVRGINKQNIFLDNFDRKKFIKRIKVGKEKYWFDINAFVLMDNHVHLVIHVKNNCISNIMHDICGSYAKYFNEKYNRVGHVFQNRFKSIPVESKKYFLNLIRYIHKNPEKAYIAKMQDYVWSSYREFLYGKKLTDIDFVLDLFDKNKEEAIQRFIQFHQEKEIDYSDNEFELEKLSDEDAVEHIKRFLNIENVENLQFLNKDLITDYIRKINSIKGITVEQISKILNMNKRTIYRIIKKNQSEI